MGRTYDWGRCDGCGGRLPRIDGDHSHPDLPETIGDGGCYGWRTEDGDCGMYEGVDLSDFARLARAEGRAS